MDARQTIQVPASTSVGLLKLLCSQLFGVSPMLQSLTLHSGPRAGESLGADNSLDLGYWGLVSGEVVSLAVLPATEVWQGLSGTAQFVVPEHWLLPPEFRPELAGIV